jgi:hypothetical protein
VNSNYGTLNEDETVHQLDDVIKIETPASKPDIASMEEATNRDALY